MSAIAIAIMIMDLHKTLILIFSGVSGYWKGCATVQNTMGIREGREGLDYTTSSNQNDYCSTSTQSLQRMYEDITVR